MRDLFVVVVCVVLLLVFSTMGYVSGYNQGSLDTLKALKAHARAEPEQIQQLQGNVQDLQNRVGILESKK